MICIISHRRKHRKLPTIVGYKINLISLPFIRCVRWRLPVQNHPSLYIINSDKYNFRIVPPFVIKIHKALDLVCFEINSVEKVVENEPHHQHMSVLRYRVVFVVKVHALHLSRPKYLAHINMHIQIELPKRILHVSYWIKSVIHSVLQLYIFDPRTNERKTLKNYLYVLDEDL